MRGNIAPPNVQDAVNHAYQVIHFEMAHGLFLDPWLQSSVLRSYHVLFLQIPSSLTISLLNSIYALSPLVVPLVVGLWVFVAHRSRFALLRNVTLLSSLLAAAGYELYPLAPPRLSGGLVVDGRFVVIHDTVRHFLGTGRLVFGSIGYNAYAAMPSAHVAWALIMGIAVFLLARRPLLRFLGLIYPLVMALVVVATGDHYLLDIAGALGTVLTAAILALSFEWGRHVLDARVKDSYLLPHDVARDAMQGRTSKALGENLRPVVATYPSLGQAQPIRTEE